MATTPGTRVLETNLTAPFVLTRELGTPMVERGAGKIIFTASLLSFQGGVLVPSYTAAKSGIIGLVRAFANEWAPHGVNVNAIAPGYVETDNTEALRNDPVRGTGDPAADPRRALGAPRGSCRRDRVPRVGCVRLRPRHGARRRRWLAGALMATRPRAGLRAGPDPGCGDR